MHADDAGLLAKCKTCISKLVRSFVNISERRGMKINVDKTKVMMIVEIEEESKCGMQNESSPNIMGRLP